jgi:hypothetical protein
LFRSKILKPVLQVSQGDIPSLRLLAALAERAPSVFVSTAVPSLVNLIHQVSSSPNAKAPGTVEALMQVLVNGGIATRQASYSNQNNMPVLPYPTKPIDTIDPTSAAAELGRTCLPLLWDALASASAPMMAILQQWTQAASACPSLLAGDRAVFEAVVQTCMMVANRNSKNEDDAAVALAALEVLSSLCAVGDVKRKILPQNPALCQRILQGDSQEQGVLALTAQYMTSGIDDDVEGWATEPASLLEDDQWDADDVALYAESLLQSFLHSLATSALAVTLPLVESLLQPSQDFRRARAALSMLEACLASAPVSFAPHAPVAMEAALSLAEPNQPIRVQFQALRLLGVLFETDVTLVNSTQTVRERHGLRVLQTLSQSVQSPCTKVSSLACLVIVSFCRGGDAAKTTEDNGSHPVVPYLSDLLQALVSGPLSLGMDQGSVVVKIRAIGAVACLAEASSEAFAPFYGTIMPGLLACSQLPHSSSPDITQLIAAAVESATIIGQAIEADENCRALYVADAGRIMDFIIPILQQAEGGTTSLDMPLEPLLSACARIASVMGADYAPFVNMVLPHLLKRATAPPDLSVTDGNEAKLNEIEVDEDLGTESMTVALPGKGMQKYTVNTSKIQEKAQAARAVYEHASALGADFGPYVEPCLEAFVPLINFKFSPEVRSTSAQAVSSLFEAACCAADESVMDMSKLQQFFPMLAKTVAGQIQSEGTAEMEALYALADSLSEIHYSVYQRMDTYGKAVASSLSYDDATATVGMTVGAISDCLKRRAKIYSDLSGGGLAGEDERQECQERLREEETLLTPLVDSIGYTLKFLNDRFVPIFDKFVAPALEKSLTNGDIRAQLSAVCLYDDCVEHCGPAAAAKYSEQLVYGVILGIDDASNGNDMELKSASIYGIAQMCRYAPSTVLAPHMETIFHNLFQVVRSSSKEESDSPMMYENAVSALASLTLIGNAPFANSGGFQREDLVKLFVDNLPIREDADEAKVRLDE